MLSVFYAGIGGRALFGVVHAVDEGQPRPKGSHQHDGPYAEFAAIQFVIGIGWHGKFMAEMV